MNFDRNERTASLHTWWQHQVEIGAISPDEKIPEYKPPNILACSLAITAILIAFILGCVYFYIYSINNVDGDVTTTTIEPTTFS